MSLLEVVVDIQKSLMFLVNSHILKMAAMLKLVRSIIEKPRSSKSFALGAQQRT